MQYLEIVINLDNIIEINLLNERIFNILHPHFKNIIGLSFPQFNSYELGRIIRCFSYDLEQLQTILYLESLVSLADNDLIIIKPLQALPINAVPVRFVRDRHIEKYPQNGKFYERERRRNVSEENMEIYLERISKSYQYSNQYNYIKVKSLSNKNHFSLFIRKEQISVEEANKTVFGAKPYSGYGLTTNNHRGFVYEW